MAVLVSCDIEYFNSYSKALANSLKQNTSHEKIYFSVTLEARSKTEYAKQRFYDALNIDEPELIIFDADTVVERDFVLPAGDVGLIFRPDNPPGTQIAAGMVVIRDKGFLREVCSRLGQYNAWTADQTALWEAYRNYKADYFDLAEFVSFDPKKDSSPPVWSAKGNRKYNDPVFREALERYDHPRLRP